MQDNFPDKEWQKSFLALGKTCQAKIDLMYLKKETLLRVEVLKIQGVEESPDWTITKADSQAHLQRGTDVERLRTIFQRLSW